MAHTAGSYPGSVAGSDLVYCYFRWRGWECIAGFPPVFCQVALTDSSTVPICTPGWRETKKIKCTCLTQEYNTMTWPALKPGLLDLESNALTIRSPHLPQKKCGVYLFNLTMQV